MSELNRIPGTAAILYSVAWCVPGWEVELLVLEGLQADDLFPGQKYPDVERGLRFSPTFLSTVDLQRSFFILALLLGKGFVEEEEIVTNEEFLKVGCTVTAASAPASWE